MEKSDFLKEKQEQLARFSHQITYSLLKKKEEIEEEIRAELPSALDRT